MGCKTSKFDVLKLKNKPSNIELKMVEAMIKRAASGECTVKSFNSIIMKFGKIDESFEKVRSVFQKFDEDFNGTIDLDELKNCFRELQVSFTDKEIKELHRESDMDESKGIDFKEFIVLLALVYLLGDRSDPTTKSRIGLPDLEATFETIADAFVFIDRDQDGYVSKKEMVKAINEVSPGQKTADDIGIKRFQEMDWNNNGMITFKEFLFAFTNWVGVEDEEDE